MEKAFKANGMDGCLDFIRSSLDSWQDMNMTIGVIGGSGCGKSSLINAIRDLNADEKEKGAAEVGSNETTTHPTEYPHPQNKQLVLVDLPGVGTPKFPQNSYWMLLKSINMTSFCWWHKRDFIRVTVGWQKN